MKRNVIPIKIVIVGDGAVGKTCTLISYASNRFPTDYVPTVFDNYVVNLTAGDDYVELSLWDTAGQEDYDRIRPLSYSGASIFLLCFSVVSKVSFDNIVSKWCPELRYFGAGIPFILLGTKVDLRSSAAPDNVMTYQQGLKLARNIQAAKYMECSAKTGENVKAVFDEAVRLVLAHKAAAAKKKNACIML